MRSLTQVYWYVAMYSEKSLKHMGNEGLSCVYLTFAWLLSTLAYVCFFWGGLMCLSHSWLVKKKSQKKSQFPPKKGMWIEGILAATKTNCCHTEGTFLEFMKVANSKNRSNVMKKTLVTSWNGHFPEIFRTLFGYFPDIFRTLVGYFPDMFGTFSGHVSDICWTCFGHVLDMFGNVFGAILIDF